MWIQIDSNSKAQVFLPTFYRGEMKFRNNIQGHTAHDERELGMKPV